ncbi:hypothetical protein HU200_066215 [Digitaria exilis]|uniref:Uncharacterized protein n=1 Tax=Digitaria exilis TaxID=1010633 RepID=A0A834ZWW8_9POAL|nr:hypothetical protein HU200_066215 [Digitaria exilis]
MAAVAATLMLLLVPSSEGQEQPAAAAAASSCNDERDCISRCPSKCRDMAKSSCAGMLDETAAPLAEHQGQAEPAEHGPPPPSPRSRSPASPAASPTTRSSRAHAFHSTATPSSPSTSATARSSPAAPAAALHLFDEMPHRTSSSWYTTVVSSFVRCGLNEMAAPDVCLRPAAFRPAVQ